MKMLIVSIKVGGVSVAVMGKTEEDLVVALHALGVKHIDYRLLQWVQVFEAPKDEPAVSEMVGAHT